MSEEWIPTTVAVGWGLKKKQKEEGEVERKLKKKCVQADNVVQLEMELANDGGWIG